MNALHLGKRLRISKDPQPFPVCCGSIRLLLRLIHVVVDGDAVLYAVAGCGDDDGVVDAGVAASATGE